MSKKDRERGRGKELIERKAVGEREGEEEKERERAHVSVCMCERKSAGGLVHMIAKLA